MCRSAPVVLQLLQGEDMLIEVLLKFLIGVVDVKLFKPIHLLKEETLLTQRSASGPFLMIEINALIVKYAEDLPESSEF